jgi:hypothetical protein
LCHGGHRCLVAELKDIDNSVPGESKGWTITKREVQGVIIQSAERKCNAVDRVGTKIHQAFKQLQQYDNPRVIIFLNDDRSFVDIEDLKEALDGYHFYGNEAFSYKNVSARRVAEGKIAEEKRQIDLYVWIERHDESVDFIENTSKGSDLRKTYFKGK